MAVLTLLTGLALIGLWLTRDDWSGPDVVIA